MARIISRNGYWMYYQTPVVKPVQVGIKNVWKQYKHKHDQLLHGCRIAVESPERSRAFVRWREDLERIAGTDVQLRTNFDSP